MSTDTNEKPKRFLIQSFASYQDCEEFLNHLDDDQVIVGFADTPRCVTVCIERIPAAEYAR